MRNSVLFKKISITYVSLSHSVSSYVKYEILQDFFLPVESPDPEAKRSSRGFQAQINTSESWPLRTLARSGKISILSSISIASPGADWPGPLGKSRTLRPPSPLCPPTPRGLTSMDDPPLPSSPPICSTKQRLEEKFTH